MRGFPDGLVRRRVRRLQGELVRLEHVEELVDVRRDAGVVGEDVEAQLSGRNLRQTVGN